MAPVMAVILAITAAPRSVNAATAAAEISAPATAYSTIVSPSSSRRSVFIDWSIAVTSRCGGLAGNRPGDVGELGDLFRAEAGECSDGGCGDQGAGNCILHHCQTLFVA